MFSIRSSVEVLHSTRWVREEVDIDESVSSQAATYSKLKDIALRKAIGALYRYRSRKLAQSYW